MDSVSSSSSSSGSSTSSGSTTCSDTGSSSDTESSSSGEEKPVQTPSNNNNSSSSTSKQVIAAAAARRKSSEAKATTTKAASTENNEKPKSTTQVVAASKVRNAAATAATTTGGNQRNGHTTLSSDDEDDDDDNADNERTARAKKPVRTGVTTVAKRKPSVSTATVAAGANASGSKAPPIGGKTAPNKPPATIIKAAQANGERKQAPLSSNDATDDSTKELRNGGRKLPAKISTTVSAVRAKQLRNKMQAAKRAATNNSNNNKSNDKSSDDDSDDSESGSGSDDEDDSSTMSDSEDESESSNSYSSQKAKNAKQKRGSAGGSGAKRSDSDDGRVSHPMRKLTRSLSMRASKQPVKQGSDSDSDLDLDGERHTLSKVPAKKPAATVLNNSASKCKVKKEIGGLVPVKSRPISPLLQLEKKCPIEGCDSSGHLSGNLDRHFLPEACPIYHNMSASECKERANERKQRSDQRQKAPITINSTPGGPVTNRTLTPEQKDFLAKIRESRARFKPISSTISDKVKLEKDCTDEDREPNLIGLVPDYDLQLFRDAQALASEKIEDELKDLPVGKGIKYITMGKYKMKVWYQSPYPDDAARLPKMYICEFCLRYQKSETGIKRHAQKCVWRHPPGDEIYRKGKLQVWQVDGKRYKQYCQHLCLLAKFFLDHKTLYYDVEPFLFYIMTLADVDGCHIVGYFSKEKNSFYNVSCILTLPPYQRKGYGRLLIDFSYLLTRVEGKIGSPEKPLSDLGLISYRSYWKDVLLDYLCSRTGNTLSIKDVSQEMAIYSYDIVSTLQALGMMKYWKGKHIVLKKQDVLDEYGERVKRRGTFPKIDDSCLRWQPFVPAQVNASP